MPEAAIADLLDHHDGYHAIQAQPGIGLVLAAVIMAEIGDISVFGPGPGCARGWANPCHCESDAKVSRGHITKQGSLIVRWASIEESSTCPAVSRCAAAKDIIGRRGGQA